MRHAERPQQWKAELEVADGHAAAAEAIESCARGGGGRAIGLVERVHVVPVHQRWVPEIEREQPLVLTAGAIAAVMHHARGDGIERRRHEVPPGVDEQSGVLHGTEGG